MLLERIIPRMLQIWMIRRGIFVRVVAHDGFFRHFPAVREKPDIARAAATAKDAHLRFAAVVAFR